MIFDDICIPKSGDGQIIKRMRLEGLLLAAPKPILQVIKLVMLQHFSSSTRSTHLCSGPDSIIS